MIFYYVRHGDPIYDPDSLTPLGQKQAQAVAKRLALHGIDRVFVSTSERAKQTCQPLCDLLHLTPTELDWCNEIHAWEEMTVLDEDGHYRWLAGSNLRFEFASDEVAQMRFAWYDHPAFADWDFKSGYERIEREAHALLASLGYTFDADLGYYRCTAPNDERVALFAHEGVGLLFLSAVLRIPYPELSMHFGISHSSVTVIHFADDCGVCIPRALQFSSDAHIYREGLPTKYNNQLYI